MIQVSFAAVRSTCVEASQDLSTSGEKRVDLHSKQGNPDDRSSLAM